MLVALTIVKGWNISQHSHIRHYRYNIYHFNLEGHQNIMFMVLIVDISALDDCQCHWHWRSNWVTEKAHSLHPCCLLPYYFVLRHSVCSYFCWFQKNNLQTNLLGKNGGLTALGRPGPSHSTYFGSKKDTCKLLKPAEMGEMALVHSVLTLSTLHFYLVD